LQQQHLSVQGRLDPRGGLHCFWCLIIFKTPPINAFGALKIIPKKIKMKKLWLLKIKGVKNSKKKPPKCYKDQFPNTQKLPCMLFYFY
jgi:hypothetical protein